MKGERQRAICEFFGEGNQIMKAFEELDEINDSFEEYLNNQNKDTLKHVLIEVIDLQNVLEGIYRQLGGTLDEIAAQKEFKLNRAMEIINKIPCGTEDKVKAYDQIRYGGEYAR